MNRQSWIKPLSFSLLLHAMILLPLSLQFNQEQPKQVVKASPEIIEASVLDEAKILAQVDALKTQQQTKQVLALKKQQQLQEQRKQEQALLEQARNKRQSEEKKAKALEAERQAKALQQKKELAALKRKQVAEKKRLDALKKQQLAEEKRLEKVRKEEQLRKQAIELKKQQALAEQRKKQAEKAARIQKEKAAAIAAAERKKQQQATAQAQRQQLSISVKQAIQAKVNQQWIRPVGSRSGLQCTVRVKLLASGDVMDVQVSQSSGDNVFDRSAENAVRKASPLPVPDDKILFNQQFRTFTFKFKPE